MVNGPNLSSQRAIAAKADRHCQPLRFEGLDRQTTCQPRDYLRRGKDRTDLPGVLERVEQVIFPEMTDHADIESALSQVTFPFGSTLKREDWNFLGHCMQRSFLAAGECLWREGEPNDRIGFVVQGQVKLLKEMNASKHPFILALMGPGSWVVDPAFFEARPRELSSFAVKEVEILFLSRMHLQGILEERPTLGEYILGASVVSFARQLQHSYRRLSAFY